MTCQAVADLTNLLKQAGRQGGANELPKAFTSQLTASRAPTVLLHEIVKHSIGILSRKERISMPKVGSTVVAVRNKSADEALPKSFDALNEAIAEAENALRSLKPLRAVWFEFEVVSSFDDSPDRRHSVGFEKHNGKWRIVYGCDDGSGEPDQPTYLLTERPIDIRVRAAAHIPKLRELIIESKEEFLSEVNNVISKLKTFTRFTTSISEDSQ